MAERPSELADLKAWFSDYELAPCPHCGARAVVRSESPSGVCLECGQIEGLPEPSAA